jgi:predicted nuclease with TOPRIM domain
MDFKTMAITATLGGSILLSGLTFTGVIDLAEIKGFGQDWANKLTQAVNNSKDMASKFNLMKSDAENLINEKIAKINELQARINELGEEVASGNLNLEDANTEIARLNEQLEQANNEVKALKDEFALKDSEVQTAFSEMVTADSLDTTLDLDTQTTTPTTPEEAPEEEAPTEAPNHEATETTIYNALTTNFEKLEELQVTVTDNQIVISEPQLLATEGTYRNVINSATGLALAMGTKNGTTITYNY